MSSPEVASLTRALGELQRQVRDLATGNPLNNGSVQSADGSFVPLSAVAFGQVAARSDVSIGLTTHNLEWLPSDPVLDVYVTGGRLRVDMVINIAVNARDVTASVGFSFMLFGPTDTAGAPGAPQVFAPSVTHGLRQSWKSDVRPDGTIIPGQFAVGAPDFVENLTPGWYRVQGYHQLFWSPDPVALPTGGASASLNTRRIIATPF